MAETTRLSRIQGSLIAGAAGDALGYAVEFMTEPFIRKEYGAGGIRSYHLSPRSGLAMISDDTQMTIFTAAGLLAGDTENRMTGRQEPLHNAVHTAYRCWYETQYPGELGEKVRLWLNGIKELNSLRAPGNTCLSAIESGRKGSVACPTTNSKGCGGVMRVAPLGLYIPMTSANEQAIIREGAELAALTHGHPLGYLPAALMVDIVGRCVYMHEPGDTLRDVVTAAIEATERCFADNADWRQFRKLMTLAVTLADGSEPDLACIHALGEGWTGHDALAIAVFCALRHADDLSACLIAAVNHKGDSDSTGAIAGNILGAWLGMEAIDRQWTDKLELCDLLLEIARDLCDGVPADLDANAPASLQRNQDWLNKYRFMRE